MIRRKTLAAAIVLSVANAASAQQGGYAPPDVAEQREKIAALGFLEGEWSGSGWTYLGPGERVTFVQRENIRPMLNGAILTIHGAGRAPEAAEDAPPVFEAFAIVSWDDKADRYRFRSYANGHVGDFDSDLESDDVFVWRMPNTEYRIEVEGDRWIETGHRTLESGERVQFFEMTLTRR